MFFSYVSRNRSSPNTQEMVIQLSLYAWVNRWSYFLRKSPPCDPLLKPPLLFSYCTSLNFPSTLSLSLLLPLPKCFPGGSDGKGSACSVGVLGSIPGSERSPGCYQCCFSNVFLLEDWDRVCVLLSLSQYFTHCMIYCRYSINVCCVNME